MREIGQGYKIIIQSEPQNGSSTEKPISVVSYIPEEIQLGFSAEYDQPFQTINSALSAIPSMAAGASLGKDAAGMAGAAIGAAGGYMSRNFLPSAAGMGSAPTAPIFTAKLWQSTSSPEITIPLYFEAENDPLQEIRQPILDLLSLVIPSVNALGILQSPASYLDVTKQLTSFSSAMKQGLNASISSSKGFLEALNETLDAGTESALNKVESAIGGAIDKLGSTVSNAVSKATGNSSLLSDVSSATIRKNTNNTASNNAESDTYNADALSSSTMMKYLNKKISIQIGTYLTFPCVVIQNVNPVFTSQIDYNTGWPMSARVDITFSPMFTVVQSDLQTMFNSIPQEMSFTNSTSYTYGTLTGMIGSVATSYLGGVADSAINSGASMIRDFTEDQLKKQGITGFANAFSQAVQNVKI